MNPGRLDQRITIQSLTETRDEWGGVVEGWTTLATTWAAVEPLQGREFIAAQSVQAETTIRVRVRYLAGVTASCRVLLSDGRTLGIVAVIDERSQHRFMQLMCRELS